MFRMTPADFRFIERAPVRIDTQLVLKQPPPQVWAVIVDSECWPEWFGSMVAARTTSKARTGVGTTRWVQVDQIKVNERIIAWDESRCWGFTVLDSNVPISSTVVERVTLEPWGEGTKLTYTFAAALKWWLRPLTPLLRREFERRLVASLAGLQPYLNRLHPVTDDAGARSRAHS